MADMNGKKRLSLNLSVFNLAETPAKSTSSSSSGNKSPKNFEEPNGVVGLGILAAMNGNSKNECNVQDQFRNAVLAVSPKSSNPIIILSNNRKSNTPSPSNKRSPTGFSNGNSDIGMGPSIEEMELCEEYTCVISHVGDNKIKKREYFDDGGFLENKNFDGSVKITTNSSKLVPFSSAVGQMEDFQMGDFLSSCFLCKKQLHGLDIFMYR